METYVMLVKLTGQGVKNIKDAPDRIKAGVGALEKLGGKLLGFYAVMGAYDYIAIGEFPNAEAAASLSLMLSAGGSVTVQTLKAFTTEEFAAIIAKLP